MLIYFSSVKNRDEIRSLKFVMCINCTQYLDEWRHHSVSVDNISLALRNMGDMHTIEDIKKKFSMHYETSIGKSRHDISHTKEKLSI